jgi:Tfp pilus assembly PilM family ATPase
MAHRIVGVDLGAYSVKLAVVGAGFRKTSFVDWIELAVPAPIGDETLEARQARAVGQLLRARGWDHDFPFTTLGGEALSMRVLDFPFHGLKRADLDKAVGAELESQLPHELDDMVYAYELLPRDAAAPAVDDGEPAAPPPAGTRILAAATTKERVSRLIAAHAAEQAEPHGVLAAPAAYARVAGALGALAGDPADGVMIVDHGHARTNVCIVARGRVVFARTLSRGSRHVTAAIARAWGMPLDEAERAKHSDGFIASSREAAPTEAWARISDVVRGELVPLARELRQTLAACRAQTGVAVARAALAGGGARLRGLAGFLADELELPVAPVGPDDAARLFGPPSGARAAAVPLDAALLSLGAALEGASGRPAFDLRQGPLAYKHDFSFLRARAGYLTGAALAVAAFFAANAYAALYALRTEQAVLDKQLETETTEIFGAPVSLEEIESRLAPARVDSPLPKMTAFDLLVEISKTLPPRGEGKIDVSELEIDPKRVYLKAVADSSATIDAAAKKLRDIECFGDVQSGRVDTVSDGKQFTFTIPAKCM